jgi:hypothetical protein
MPLAEMVARMGAEGDAALAQHVSERINPSHRTEVLKVLRSPRRDSRLRTNLPRVLDAVLNGDDPLIGYEPLAQALGMSKSDVKVAFQFLSRKIAGKRTELLRAMGFSYEQIFDMSSVGQELGKRLDPNLGAYSDEERQAGQGVADYERRSRSALAAGADDGRSGRVQLPHHGVFGGAQRPPLVDAERHEQDVQQCCAEQQ